MGSQEVGKDFCQGLWGWGPQQSGGKTLTTFLGWDRSLHYTAQRSRVFPLREHPELRLERKQEEGRASHHDRVHSVSESRATQGLPATPSVVLSSSVSLRQNTIVCLKGSSSHYPTTTGCCPDSQDRGPFSKEDCKRDRAPQEQQCCKVPCRESFPTSL